ncbi:MAG: response regulator [Alphaproteobacteria bacterium]|nr:response regulator [Alphaproteobacteria bacterium]
MTTVLLVDDDAALTHVIAEALQLQLAERELQVHAVPGWEGALRVAEEVGTIDVLVVDYHLGPHTGIELFRDLSARFPAMRPLLYTGKATASVEAEARASGIPVLWKPQRLEALTRAVRSLIDGVS